MNSRFLFFIILTFLSTHKSWGQFTALNSYFKLGQFTKFKDIVYENDSLTILGEVYEPLSVNEQNACIIRADTFGNIAKVKYFYIPLSDSPHLLSENAQLTQTSDGGFIFSGQIFFKPNVITIVKVNHDFEIEFFKELHPEGGTCFPQKVIETKDAYYIGLFLGYGIQDKDLQYCIVKTDLQGNKLWQKFYGSEERYEILTNIKSFKEGEITLLGNKGLANDQGRVSISNIDTSGNLIKEIFNVGDGEGSIYDFDTLSNGDFIYTATKWIDIPNYIGSLRVYRIDSTGKVIWKKIVNDGVHNAYLYRMLRNTDGSYTIIGKEEGKGRSVCITQDGDILWQHIYKLPFSPMPIQYYSGLLGMTALPTGNIIACGYFRNLTDQIYREQGWLVKMDADGCIDKNCKTLLGDQEVIEIDELNVGVYPNPSNGLLKVNLPSEVTTEACSIVFYDIIGNKLLNKTLSPGINQIDLNIKVSSGVLIYTIITEKGTLIKSGKVIITK